MKKLDEAKRRFGVVSNKPWPRVLDAFPGADKLAFDPPTREQRLERQVQALQDLLNQKDMEIDFLATARPTVLRLDWYLIGLVSLVVAVHEVGWL